MTSSRRFLVFQTAFPGDVLLTLPLLQHLRRSFPAAHIACVTIPLAGELLRNHPAVSARILFDKRGEQRGIGGLFSLANRLRSDRYDTAIIPHRSLRSALAVALAGIPRRVGFDKSAGRILLTDVVRYDSTLHEIDRNLSLLGPLDLTASTADLPSLYPGSEEIAGVDEFLRQWHSAGGQATPLVALAPGSVWATKRWPAERYSALGRLLTDRGFSLVLLGSADDAALCAEVVSAVGSRRATSAAGKFSLLGAAELIRRCAMLVSNDSAPMHIAVAMRVPVIAIFGPTVPAFGFAPRGPRDSVIGQEGLACRPCSIHGGPRCPIDTFECMLSITAAQVLARAEPILQQHVPG